MKRFAAALTLTTALLAFAPVPLTAQARPVPPAPPSASQMTSYGEPSADAETLRERFKEILSRYPASVGRVLRLDPTLFNDATYMASYPDIAQFVARYPQISRNAEFYLRGYGTYESSSSPSNPRERSIDLMENTLGGLAGLTVFIVVTMVLVWITRSIVNHRRWLRVSKTQTEVHTKLLDRFSSSDELLAYIKTPAGSRFLESAPLNLDSDSPRSVHAPLNRILWSVQAGVILLIGGAALVFARHQIDVEEVRQMLYLLGTVAAGIGIGFIVSAAASFILSRRLGLLDGTVGAPRPSVHSGRVDSSGL